MGGRLTHGQLDCYSFEHGLFSFVPDSLDPLIDPSRLAALAKVMVATATKSEELDAVAAKAAWALKVPIALITFVSADDQTFRGEHGLPATLAMIRRMPISYSICQFTVREPLPLLIPDTEIHPLLKGHPSVVEMGIRAYLGIPLNLATGETVGSVSFVDYVPRNWSASDLATAEKLTAEVAAFLDELLQE